MRSADHGSCGFAHTSVETFGTLSAMAAPALGPKARRPRRTTTIAQIAEQAGVSVPTVSKVINGRSDVAPETRRRVEAAIRDVGLPAARRARPAARR